MKIVVTGFVNTMTKPQRIAGYIYLPFHIILFPLFVGMLAVYLPSGLSDLTENIVYYGLGFAFCLIFMWGYLRMNFDILLDNLRKNILVFILACTIFYLLSYLAAGIMLEILGDQFTNPNNAAVVDLAGKSPRAVIALTVLIAPVVEETLFRGVVFGALRTKNRFLAFAVSIALFAFYHVWQYALSSMDWKLLIYIIEYIPAGYALAWLYEKTDCIWLPIFLHMTVNLITMTALL